MKKLSFIFLFITVLTAAALFFFASRRHETKVEMLKKENQSAALIVNKLSGRLNDLEGEQKKQELLLSDLKSQLEAEKVILAGAQKSVSVLEGEKNILSVKLNALAYDFDKRAQKDQDLRDDIEKKINRLKLSLNRALESRDTEKINLGSVQMGGGSGAEN